MNISKRQKGELGAVITIEVSPEDYQPRVNQTINNYRKQASIPGFRPGQVPASVIRKKFGKEVLIEELNKMLGEELLNYLRENKIDVLGSPLPIYSAETISFEDGKNFSFDYEIGFAPVVDVKIPEFKIPFFLIQVDDKMIDDDINDMRRRYGKFSNPDAVEANSVLYGDFTEADANGEIKEGGNTTTTTLSIEMMNSDEERNKFIGAKKDDTIRFNPMAAMKNETEVAAMLRLAKDSPSLHADYIFKIKTVNRIEKADINQELFDKAFGEGIIHSEEEFRNKIKEGIASYFNRESERKLQKDIKKIFLENNNLALPDEFLKKVLKNNQEKPVDDHEFEHTYFHVAEDLKWNLMQKKIAGEQSYEISENDIFDSARLMISQQFAQYGMPAPEDEKLNEMVKNYLSKDNNWTNIENTLLSQKVFDYLKGKLQLDNMELPYIEFIEKMNEKTAHELEHHH
jgi:trigger factor